MWGQNLTSPQRYPPNSQDLVFLQCFAAQAHFKIPLWFGNLEFPIRKLIWREEAGRLRVKTRRKKLEKYPPSLSNGAREPRTGSVWISWGWCSGFPSVLVSQIFRKPTIPLTSWWPHEPRVCVIACSPPMGKRGSLGKDLSSLLGSVCHNQRQHRLLLPSMDQNEDPCIVVWWQTTSGWKTDELSRQPNLGSNLDFTFYSLMWPLSPLVKITMKP